ncbi:MAG TPA: hypothetical protein VL172_01225 [Kofleriaceae bacterium]|nr:hypothetical protein [Kofleriaceae bacterium]
MPDDPSKPAEPSQPAADPDPGIGERARAVASSTGAAASAIGKQLRDGLRGTRTAADANVPAKLRRLGKDTAGLLGKVTETTGRGMRKVAGQVVGSVKTVVDEVRERPGQPARDRDGDGGDPADK